MVRNSEGAGRLRQLFDVAAWRYYASFYTGFYRKIVATGLVSAAQGLLVLPILLLIRYAFDQAIPNKNTSALIWIGISIFVIQLVSSAISIWLKKLHIDIIHHALFKLRKNLILKLYDFSRNLLTNKDYKILQARIVQDTERLSNMSNTLITRLLPSVITTAVLFILLLFLSWYLFLFLMLLVPVLLILNRYMGKIVKEKVFLFQRSFERFSKGIFFIIRYMDLTRIQSGEKQEISRQSDILYELQQTTVNMFFINAINSNAQSIVTRLSAVLIITMGGIAVANEGMTLGGLLSFFLAANYLYNHVNIINNSFAEIVAGNESLVTLKNLSKESDTQPYTGTKKIEVNGLFSLKSIWFKYDEQHVLEGLNLEISPGSKTAIIGKNGSGKTSILNLLLGFYRPDKGEVSVDNIAYQELDLNHLRKSLGVVMQHPSLFSGTVFENITYGMKNHVAEDDVIFASKQALAHDFIKQLPESYNTQIGEDGILLSGGECQKIAIARALISSPKLLILDEPTNHLDSATIKVLMENLRNLDHKQAILLISHDKSVIRLADTVYELDQKKLHLYELDQDPDATIVVN